MTIQLYTNLLVWILRSEQLLLHIRNLVQHGAGLEADAVVVVLRVAPGPYSPGPETEKDRPDEFSETGGVDRILLRFITAKKIGSNQIRRGQISTSEP